MNLEHRKIIEIKLHYLIETLSFDVLNPFLKESRMFNKYMWDDLKTISDVLDLLPSRGPKAFEIFIEVLRKAGYNKEADTLECPQEKDIGLYYKMASEPLGYCLIINNVNFKPSLSSGNPLENRDGSDVDAKSLLRFFEDAGFKVAVKDNRTAEEMKTCIEKFSQEDFKVVDSMILVILSHGGQKKGLDFVYGTDGKLLYKNVICDMFNNENEALQNKPKMFFFVSCRGKGFGYGVPKAFPRESSDSSVIKPALAKFSVMPLCSDMFLFHSTLPTEYSLRDHDKGSYFVQALIPVLEQFYLTHDLESMIKMVNSELTRKKSQVFRCFQVAHTEKVNDTKLIMLSKQNCCTKKGENLI